MAGLRLSAPFPCRGDAEVLACLASDGLTFCPTSSSLARFILQKNSKTKKNLEAMSCVNVTNVQVLENPAKFTDLLQFEISFECLSQLKEGL